ncbi:MAG: energy transducer TonB [Calditrichaeota bacterium]|nr:MAG: energy transducer TonB [Calditrichota bacterium]
MNDKEFDKTFNLKISDENPEDFFRPRLTELPKEFKKSWKDSLDTRYLSILAVSFILHISLVTYFLLNPPPKEKTMEKIAKIQKRLAEAIKKREAKLTEPIAKFEFSKKKSVEEPEEKTPKTGPKKARKAKPAPQRPGQPKSKTKAKKPRPRLRGGAGSTRKTREEIASAISSKGILALLTSTSDVAQGEEVEDILGPTTLSNDDFDKALSQLSGIKTGAKPAGKKDGQGKGYGNVKGGRASGKGSIDNLVEGLGSAKSSSFERAGDLVVASESPLIEEASGKNVKGRNPDDLQAIIMKHNSAIQYCYEKELKRNPDLKGKLMLRIIITPQGTVKSVKIISSTLNNRRVERCVVNRIKRWSDFGAIDPRLGDTAIRQTYTFGY